MGDYRHSRLAGGLPLRAVATGHREDDRSGRARERNDDEDCDGG
jgi:hypothetical protein